MVLEFGILDFKRIPCEVKKKFNCFFIIIIITLYVPRLAMDRISSFWFESNCRLALKKIWTFEWFMAKRGLLKEEKLWPKSTPMSQWFLAWLERKRMIFDVSEWLRFYFVVLYIVYNDIIYNIVTPHLQTIVSFEFFF